MTTQNKHRGLAWKILLAFAVVAVGVLVWRFTPLREMTRPEELVQRLEEVEKSRWAPFIFVGFYLVGGLVMFPVTVLGGAVAIIFSPLKAVAVSFTGITLSAALHHWIGAHFFKKRAVAALGRIQQRVDEVLADRSIVTIAALRMVPIAPFTLVNIVAGCMGVRLRDFLLGTALGLLPSITIVCLFGRQVRAFWRDPSASGVAMIGAVVAAWVCLAFGLQWFVSRRKAKRPAKSTTANPSAPAADCSRT